MKISVILPTHNPHPGRLQRTLRALRAQTLPAADWETVLVDNASAPALGAAGWAAHGPANLRLVPEPEPGLSHARRRGFVTGAGEFFVLVDDDNELAPDYLAETLRLFAAHPGVGLLGGRSRPDFEAPPAAWVREFDGLIACRDLGDTPLISSGLRDPATDRNDYPMFAPIGAGMALRRAAAQSWLDQRGAAALPDRKGGDLSSSGDNDIVLAAMEAGWEAAYFPSLSLTHLIPASRTTPDYLGRLNRGIQRSWMQVLTRHGANPWPPLAPASLPLRRAKAWFTYRAWSSPAAHVRWQGACGHFEGRVPLFLMARVRVYLLTYRRNHLLPRALDSLLAQTFTDWVCELHNDDPADPFPVQLAARTADPRIVMRQHEKNLGGTGTFNLVFAPVAETYVCLLEDDNWWEPGFLAKMVAFADAHPEAGFVWSDQRIWQETTAGGWLDTGRRTMSLLHPGETPAGATLYHWPQPRQRFDTFHYNGSALFRTAEVAGRLQVDPAVPQIAMETFRDRALRWPGLFVPEPLVNFSWTIATAREPQTELWLVYRALLDGSFLHCCPPGMISAHEFWQAAVDARPTQTGSTLLHAWVAGRFGEFAALARPRDWLRLATHALRRPRSFWRTLRARARHAAHWEFLVTETRRRFAEAAAQGGRGWGAAVPVKS